jgi:hypothetical protein
MIDHVWTVICSNAVIDQFSNNVSLHNVIEQVNIRDEPRPSGAFSATIHVMTLWARSDFNTPNLGHARLAFLSPSGVVGNPFEYEIDLSNDHRSRMRTIMHGLPLEESGRHAFTVELQNEGETEWRQVAVIPLEVIFEPSEKTEQADDQLE